MTRCLNARGCDVTLLPAHTPAEEILSGGYDGVMLSNGPGDPADNVEIIAQVRKLYEVRPAHLCRLPGPPVDGAGHRGLHPPAAPTATGGPTTRCGISRPAGCSSPARTTAMWLTSESVDPAVAEVSHVNVNDGTVRGPQIQE